VLSECFQSKLISVLEINSLNQVNTITSTPRNFIATSATLGLKESLQRRLHGLLVQAAIAQRSEAAVEDGMGDDGQGGSRGTESAPPAKRVRTAVP
jgi:hypothetical protein